LFILAVDLDIHDIDWPRPITVLVIVLTVLCWLAINGAAAMHVTLRVPMQPAWAKPILVAAIVCITVGVSIPTIGKLWDEYPTMDVSLDLLALALVLLLVNMVAIAVRSR
jgi:hypothetical protein